MVLASQLSLDAVVASIGRYTNDAIVITDSGDNGPHKILWCNAAFHSITGFTPEEVIGQSPALLQGPDTDDDHRRLLREALNQWQSVRQEILNYRKNGESFWIELSITPVTDSNGHCHFWVASQRDISERKKLEAELRATKHRLERVASEADQHRARLTGLVDNAPGSLYEFAMDTDGNFSLPYLSEGFAELYGLPKERVADFPSMVFDLVHPEDIEDLHQSILASAQTLTRWTNRWRVDHPQGERWLEASSMPNIDETTGTIVWSGFMSDVTSQVSWEQKLEKAKLEAESANEAKSEFLANMSHEIRTPLNGVLGMAQALNGTPLDTVQQDYLESIVGAGEGLLSVLNDILDFSKIESQHVEVVSRPFDLEHLCAGIHRIHSVHAQEKGLGFELSVHLGAGKGRLGDPDRVTQVLHNLIGNAVKFTHQGRVTLDVRGASSHEVVFTVADTGCGIPAEHMPKLFERFNQGEAGLKRQHSGTGLGLAISKGLIELMGGELTVESQIDRGTVFTFTLPLHAVQLPVEPPVAEPQQQAAVSILCADDTEINQKVLTALLKPFGHRIVIANNGQEAVDLYEVDSFDIVLMDIQMPVMDGVEALSQIRSLQAAGHGRSVPVIAISGNAMDHQVQEYLSAGFDAVMSKPINIAKLTTFIATLCGVASDSKAPTASPARPRTIANRH